MDGESRVETGEGEEVVEGLELGLGEFGEGGGAPLDVQRLLIVETKQIRADRLWEARYSLCKLWTWNNSILTQIGTHRGVEVGQVVADGVQVLFPGVDEDRPELGMRIPTIKTSCVVPKQRGREVDPIGSRLCDRGEGGDVGGRDDKGGGVVEGGSDDGERGEGGGGGGWDGEEGVVGGEGLGGLGKGGDEKERSVRGEGGGEGGREWESGDLGREEGDVVNHLESWRWR